MYARKASSYPILPDNVWNLAWLWIEIALKDSFWGILCFTESNIWRQWQYCKQRSFYRTGSVKQRFCVSSKRVPLITDDPCRWNPMGKISIFFAEDWHTKLGWKIVLDNIGLTTYDTFEGNYIKSFEGGFSSPVSLHWHVSFDDECSALVCLSGKTLMNLRWRNSLWYCF